jgi:D-3-phosphoglycerate dehydrogenase / 2-oxoglutarate reductase
VKRILLSKPIHPRALKLLEGKVELVTLADSTDECTRRMVADADGVILRTNISFTREIIAAAARCRIISRTGVGVDNVDVAAATEKGIMVCNTPGVNTVSVAEQTLALILGCAKRLLPMDRAVRTGNWKIRNAAATVDLESKVLGLVGLGRIGVEVARRCRAFSMSVIGFDPLVKTAEGIEVRADIEEVFREADFISLHVPYTQETHHLAGARLLGLMKGDAFLINTSRGSVVDEMALVDLLTAGGIAGAGLDVLEQEPPSPENGLFCLENVLLTPHSAALSRECEMKVAIEAAQAVLDFVEGRVPKAVFNRGMLGLK